MELSKMAKLSLLEKAMSIPKTDKRLEKINPEHMELAIGWLQGIVSLTQVAQATGGKTPGAAISKIAIWLREAYRNDMLRVVTKNV